MGSSPEHPGAQSVGCCSHPLFFFGGFHSPWLHVLDPSYPDPDSKSNFYLIYPSGTIIYHHLVIYHQYHFILIPSCILIYHHLSHQVFSLSNHLCNLSHPNLLQVIHPSSHRLPPSKRLHNYGKIHHAIHGKTLTSFWLGQGFNSRLFVITGGYIHQYPSIIPLSNLSSIKP